MCEPYTFNIQDTDLYNQIFHHVILTLLFPSALAGNITALHSFALECMFETFNWRSALLFMSHMNSNQTQI